MSIPEFIIRWLKLASLSYGLMVIANSALGGIQAGPAENEQEVVLRVENMN